MAVKAKTVYEIAGGRVRVVVDGEELVLQICRDGVCHESSVSVEEFDELFLKILGNKRK